MNLLFPNTRENLQNGIVFLLCVGRKFKGFGFGSQGLHQPKTHKENIQRKRYAYLLPLSIQWETCCLDLGKSIKL